MPSQERLREQELEQLSADPDSSHRHPVDHCNCPCFSHEEKLETQERPQKC